MADQDVDALVATARAELRRNLDATPPNIDRVAQGARTRRRALSGLVAAFAILAVAIPLALSDHDDSSRIAAGPSRDEPNADLLQPGEARAMARSPLAGRSTMAAVWTGHEMLIWGGDGPDGQFADGASYDPRSDAWTLLPPSPLSARNAPAAVWTGEEVVLWGGSSGTGDLRDGAAYNPTTQRWRSIAVAPLASAGRPVGVWTGSEMIVLAGFNSRATAAYDPVNDRWRTLPELPAQLQAPNPVGVWADGEVFTVVSSGSPDPNGVPQVISLRIDGTEWSSVRQLPPGQAVLAWVGDSLLVATGTDSFELRGGDTIAIASAPSGVSVGDTPAVWTGAEFLLWEGDVASAIDPAAKVWRVVPSGDSSRRTQPAVVWADGVLLAWGGFPDQAGGTVLRPPGRRQQAASNQPDFSSVSLADLSQVIQQPTAIAAANGHVWITGYANVNGGTPATLLDFDAASGAFVGAVTLPDDGPYAIGVAGDAVWVRSQNGEQSSHLLKVEAASHRIVSTLTLTTSGGMAVTDDAVWTVDADRVIRVDPGTAEIVATVPLCCAGYQPLFVTSGPLGTWLTNPYSNELFRVDEGSSTAAVVASLDRAGPIVQTDDSLWVNTGTGLTAIDPTFGVVGRTVDLGARIIDVAPDGRDVWVITDNGIYRVDTGPNATPVTLAPNITQPLVVTSDPTTGSTWVAANHPPSVHMAG